MAGVPQVRRRLGRDRRRVAEAKTGHRALPRASRAAWGTQAVPDEVNIDIEAWGAVGGRVEAASSSWMRHSPMGHSPAQPITAGGAGVEEPERVAEQIWCEHRSPRRADKGKTAATAAATRMKVMVETHRFLAVSKSETRLLHETPRNSKEGTIIMGCHPVNSGIWGQNG